MKIGVRGNVTGFLCFIAIAVGIPSAICLNFSANSGAHIGSSHLPQYCSCKASKLKLCPFTTSPPGQIFPNPAMKQLLPVFDGPNI